MKEIILVTGGSRSGKSRFALEAAEKISGNRIFMATCQAKDREMAERIAKHKAERDGSWLTLEVPVKISESMAENYAAADVILIDCLTLWISNLFGENDDAGWLEQKVQEMVDTLKEAPCTVVLVTNEVGMGIVPENEMARKFRDISGLAGQRIAKAADRVIWMVAGIPVMIKGAR